MNGALSCQHSSVDRPLAAATVVMFKWDVAGGVSDRVKIEPMVNDGRKSRLTGGINE